MSSLIFFAKSGGLKKTFLDPECLTSSCIVAGGGKREREFRVPFGLCDATGRLVNALIPGGHCARSLRGGTSEGGGEQEGILFPLLQRKIPGPSIRRGRTASDRTRSGLRWCASTSSLPFRVDRFVQSPGRFHYGQASVPASFGGSRALRPVCLGDESAQKQVLKAGPMLGDGEGPTGSTSFSLVRAVFLNHKSGIH